MATYSRYRRLGNRYYYGFLTRGRRYYSRSRRQNTRALGNATAARQQRDSTTVTINRIASVNVQIESGNTAGSAYIQHWDSLFNSQFYSNYSSMYDQMKIDRIRVKLVGNSATTNTSSQFFSPTVILAFDRNGIDTTQAQNGLAPELVSTYSSAQLKNWSTGNAFSMYQTIYPSTMQEKSQYVSTNLLAPSNDGSTSTYPRDIYTNPACPFKPITLLSVVLNGLTVEATQTFGFTAEIEYTVTFRGMRKPSIYYIPSSGNPVLPISVAGIGLGYLPTPDEGMLSAMFSSFTATATHPMPYQLQGRNVIVLVYPDTNIITWHFNLNDELLGSTIPIDIAGSSYYTVIDIGSNAISGGGFDRDEFYFFAALYHGHDQPDEEYGSMYLYSAASLGGLDMPIGHFAVSTPFPPRFFNLDLEGAGQ